ncbi:protein-tyrosine-phosphatase [Nakamurella sp. YIM 132087]|uniref:Protein-tyrosine-phosphatase n=1 Tax=Nakamurella alba TaxID=2665158 RepID=A0A7K1FNE8_9ACTN|nr:tyrosine-protein phosphatase [Nakamurella alba]MTD14753.1 protein-tyrosine-phosphatase [Nakamurella alba]
MTLTRRELLLGLPLAALGLAGMAACGATEMAGSASEMPAGGTTGGTTTAAAQVSDTALTPQLTGATPITNGDPGAQAWAGARQGPALLTGQAAVLPTPPIPDSAAPRLASADNFRDLAGGRTGYAAAGGATIATGVFYRSNELTLSPEDSATLSGLGITRIYDLRLPSQIAKHPDVVPGGATYVNVSLFGKGIDLEGNDSTATGSQQILEEMNVALVEETASQQAMAQLLTDMAAAPGPVLFHCTQGKDRTGWTAALLLSIAGVSSGDIMTDYLLTNSYTAADIQHETDKVASEDGAAAAAAAIPMLGAEADFIKAALQRMEQYGGVETYLTSVLGLDDSVIDAVRGKLTAS